MFICTALTYKRKELESRARRRLERQLNSAHETHIVFENLSNINRDMLQKAWGLNIGEDGR